MYISEAELRGMESACRSIRDDLGRLQSEADNRLHPVMAYADLVAGIDSARSRLRLVERTVNVARKNAKGAWRMKV